MILDNISILPLARNLICEVFLRSDATHLIFIDADMEFRPSDIIKMLDYCHFDVIGGLYPKKSINFRALYNYSRTHETPSDTDLREISGDFSGMFQTADGAQEIPDLVSPFPVNYLPTGMMMIARRTFERLVETGIPRVKSRMLSTSKEEGRLHVFFDNSISGDGYYLGEDFTFCDRVRAMGGEIMACPWFVTSHVGQMSYRGNLGAIADADLVLD